MRESDFRCTPRRLKGSLGQAREVFVRTKKVPRTGLWDQGVFLPTSVIGNLPLCMGVSLWEALFVVEVDSMSHSPVESLRAFAFPGLIQPYL